MIHGEYMADARKQVAVFRTAQPEDCVLLSRMPVDISSRVELDRESLAPLHI